MKTSELKEELNQGKYDELLKDLYADSSLLEYQKSVI